MSHKSGVYTRDGRSSGRRVKCDLEACPHAPHHVGVKGFKAHRRSVMSQAAFEVAGEQVGSQQWDPAAARKAANMAKAFRWSEVAE